LRRRSPPKREEDPSGSKKENTGLGSSGDLQSQILINDPNKHLHTKRKNILINIELGAMIRVPVDMVILSTGLEARSDAAEVARLFNISRSADGFFLEKHPKLDPVATSTDGIFIAGCCQGPKDIPDSVAQAARRRRKLSR
jgi:heterodisulfide reductase subunit A-like polyferredoxin